MANRAARRHPVPLEVTPKRITLPSGSWYELGEMSGRDFLFMRSMQGRPLTDEDVAGVLAMIERRVTASSAADPLDQPLTELLEVLRRWFTAAEDTALPPAIATS